MSIGASVPTFNPQAYPVKTRASLDEGAIELLNFYVQQVYEFRGQDITKGLTNNDVVAIINFVKRWGLDDSKAVIETAFGPKFNGHYNDINFGSVLFNESSFGWIPKMLLDAYYTERAAEKHKPDAPKFTLNYL
jgi:hypothetical protein